MSDLIVIGYPDETTAQRVWDELTRLERDFLVDLDYAAIIRRDRKGKLRLTTPAHHAAAWGALSGLFWGHGHRPAVPVPPRLAGRSGNGIAGAALGAAADLGIKDDFKQRVQDMLQPGTSAILVIVRKTTPDKFLEALRPLRGDRAADLAHSRRRAAACRPCTEATGRAYLGAASGAGGHPGLNGM